RDESLREQRLASLGDVQERLQRERLAEAERQRALQEQQRVVQQQQQQSQVQPAETRFSKPDCVEVEHLYSVPGFSMIRNYCGYGVLIEMTNKPVMNYGS